MALRNLTCWSDALAYARRNIKALKNCSLCLHILKILFFYNYCYCVTLIAIEELVVGGDVLWQNQGSAGAGDLPELLIKHCCDCCQ